MTKAFKKSLIRNILKSLGRYLAILAITGLGTGLFSGLKVSKTAMVDIYDKYVDEAGFFDYRLISTLGFIEDDVKEFIELDDVSMAEGSFSMELLLLNEGHESAYRLHTLTDKINKVDVIKGRMPEADNECLADALLYTAKDIGKELPLSDMNTDAVNEAVSVKSYIITGIVNSPLYIHADRGSAAIGNGKLTGFIYVKPESIEGDYLTDIYIILNKRNYIYSSEYNEYVKNMEEPIKELCETITQKKYDDLIAGMQGVEFLPEEMSIALPKPSVYLLNRNTVQGYVSYENDTEIVSGISNIFPVFFLMVAILICITTMVRMVDDERTQIGILKALGYSSYAIIKKYLYYACSASFLGWLFGYTAGTYAIPRIIWMAYQTLYRFSDIEYIFDVELAVATLVLALLCSGLAVIYSCYKELASHPAEIMRPKAPKIGKRVLIERIPMIWKHLSFLMKVSIRNVFRYKNRLFMMILGVSGCTALLVAGFGIKDSIQNVAKLQYGQIMLYDAEATFTKGYETAADFFEESGYNMENSMPIYTGSVDITAGEKSNDASLVVFESERIVDFINFNKDNKTVTPPGKGQAVISSKLAKMLNINIGDDIKLTTADQRSLDLSVSGIYENYIGNYVYVIAESCIDNWEGELLYNCAFIKFDFGSNEHQKAIELMEIDSISNVSMNSDKREIIDNSLSSINYIVIMVVICAGALAFIVIYNLTNINIIERTREIATINVLGFYPNETASYVLRENIILSIVGIWVGLFLGKYLHMLIMAMVSVTNISFEVRISFLSYFISFVLTLIFSMLVNVVMFAKIGRIPMAESLKTVE